MYYIKAIVGMFTSSYLEVLMFQVHAKPCKQCNEWQSMKLCINISLLFCILLGFWNRQDLHPLRISMNAER